MRERLAIGAAIIALSFLSYFEFPGHTYLGSDTQIYVPMLEHIWDPSALTRDLVAAKPHLAYTLYDEIAIALRWLTHSSFKMVLIAQQFLFRTLEILGVYLLALSFPLARAKALTVAALFTLGATIAGPAVLVFEYEPVPRAFAIGLLFLAIGLVAQGHLMWADIVAAIAFLYHPPTVWVFWLLYLWLTLRHRDFRDLWPLAAGVAILFVSSRLQPGAAEHQVFFARVSPELEQLQRMRASYNWVSTWQPALLWQYVVLWIASLVAFWRIKPKTARLFLMGMPALGIMSVPLSYVLLEKLKWALIPQFQPARAVLFVTAFAMILGAAAAIRAAEHGLWVESVAWFTLILTIPCAAPIFAISGRNLALMFGLAALLTFAVSLSRWNWSILTAAAIVPFFALPHFAHVVNYQHVDLAAIDDLAHFAQTRTPKDAVFLFGDAGSGPNPSIFRAVALRAVYVDWKSGGQMNFSEAVAHEWWARWRETNELHFDPAEVARLRSLAIDYLVLPVARGLTDRRPEYSNSRFSVYKL